MCQTVHENSDSFKFTCQLKLADDIVLFEAYGKSKNEARKAVCELAYNYLKEEGQLFSIKDEIDIPNLEDSINQLEILARRGYFTIPTYEFEENHDDNGNPVWTVSCRITEKEKVFSAVDSSKKMAKKKAAFMMLNYVLERERLMIGLD